MYKAEPDHDICRYTHVQKHGRVSRIHVCACICMYCTCIFFLRAAVQFHVKSWELWKLWKPAWRFTNNTVQLCFPIPLHTNHNTCTCSTTHANYLLKFCAHFTELYSAVFNTCRFFPSLPCIHWQYVHTVYCTYVHLLWFVYYWCALVYTVYIVYVCTLRTVHVHVHVNVCVRNLTLHNFMYTYMYIHVAESVTMCLWSEINLSLSSPPPLSCSLTLSPSLSLSLPLLPLPLSPFPSPHRHTLVPSSQQSIPTSP